MGRFGERERNVLAGADRVRHVLADESVAAGDGADELSSLVPERDVDPVDFELAAVLDVVGFQKSFDPSIELSQLVRLEHVPERKFARDVLDFWKFAVEWRADTLGRGVGRDEIGVLGLERDEFFFELVADGLRDDLPIFVEVRADCVPKLGAQLADPDGGLVTLHFCPRNGTLWRQFWKMTRTSWHRQWWKKSSSRRSPWGGEIASMAEVKRLNDKIIAHEAMEADAADAMLERELKKLPESGTIPR